MRQRERGLEKARPKSKRTPHEVVCALSPSCALPHLNSNWKGLCGALFAAGELEEAQATMRSHEESQVEGAKGSDDDLVSPITRTHGDPAPDPALHAGEADTKSLGRKETGQRSLWKG